MRNTKRNRERFYLLGGAVRSERGSIGSFSSSDSVFSDSVLNEILARGSDFSFENLGFFDSQGSLIEGMGVEEEVSGWKVEKRSCGRYRKGWTGDGA